MSTLHSNFEQINFSDDAQGGASVAPGGTDVPPSHLAPLARSAPKSGVQVDFDTLYPAIGTSNDLTIDYALIAGLGDKTDDSCGEGIYKRMVHCSAHPEHARYQVGGTSCKQPTCPVCWTMWAHRGADRISCRTDGFRQFARAPPRHIILSLQPGDVNHERLLKMPAQRAYDVIKGIFIKKAMAYGLTGGSLIVHTYRTNDQVSQIKDKKKWQWVREQGRENFFKFVDFEIHAHIAGYGYLVQPKKGEFLYKNKGPLHTRDDIEKWAYYALSHAPIIPGKQSVVYFGTCSNRQLKPSWIHQCSTELRCEECGAVMIYEDFNEVVLVKRTFAQWDFLPNGFEDTRTSKGPPGGGS